MDAAGKDGAIKHVMSGINPQGCQVYSFKSPSAEDLYALFGSSRHLAIGPTFAISLMVGASVAPLAMGDPLRFAQLATLAALVAAALFTLAWLLRLSSLINFISETILLGFKAGAGLSIAVLNNGDQRSGLSLGMGCWRRWEEDLCKRSLSFGMS